MHAIFFEMILDKQFGILSTHSLRLLVGKQPTSKQLSTPDMGQIGEHKKLPSAKSVRQLGSSPSMVHGTEGSTEVAGSATLSRPPMKAVTRIHLK